MRAEVNEVGKPVDDNINQNVGQWCACNFILNKKMIFLINARMPFLMQQASVRGKNIKYGAMGWSASLCVAVMMCLRARVFACARGCGVERARAEAAAA